MEKSTEQYSQIYNLRGTKSYLARPSDLEKLTPEQLNQKLKRETTQAVHSIKIFFIKNSIWISLIIGISLFCIIIDLCTCLFYSKAFLYLIKH